MKNAFAASTLARPDVQRLNSAFAWVCALLAVALPLAVLKRHYPGLLEAR